MQNNFIHKPFQPGETIAAIATPPGEGGIAIIRLSGDRAIAVADQIFSGPVSSYLSHTAHFGRVIDARGLKIDEALLIVMRAPRSYTGEDTVEIQCHGGMIASRRVLERAFEAGARAASPGEFTFKAFMNGRLDLTQAEAVQKLISAKNEKAFEVAEAHLEGALSKKIQSFQKELTSIAAILEAWVDFPEEGIEFASFEEIQNSLQMVFDAMKQLLTTFHNGKKLDHGINLCIAGPPNAGKSSLMNCLVGKERAIVTPIAGTTRDLVHEELTLNGIHFRLTDTAGIHSTDEIIEQEGIRRSKKAMGEADLILLVFDASCALDHEAKNLLESAPREKSILVWNKIDLPRATPYPETIEGVSISAKKNIGIELLHQKIDQLIWEKGAPQKDEVVITSLRQKCALNDAIESCDRVLKGLSDGISPEFLTADIRNALMELGKIIGRDISLDILSEIFSKFCIGK